jgi:hypothetical protein
MVGVTYQEIHLFVEFLKEQYGEGRPDYIEALNDLDGLVEVSYREAIERFNVLGNDFDFFVSDWYVCLHLDCASLT